MTKRIAEILKRLDEAYGTEYVCYLNHETPWQLLIADYLKCAVYRCESQYRNKRPVSEISIVRSLC